MKIKRHSLIFGLSYALDIAGKNNLSHSKSTAYLSVMIGREIGLGEDIIIELYYTALLHDIAISNSYEMIPHCQEGAEMVKKLPLSESISHNIYYHHEYFNGTGLFGLSGDDIPVCGQIVCFASAFDDRFGKMTDTFDEAFYQKVCTWVKGVRHLFSTEIISAFEKLILRESFLLDYFNQETKYKLSERVVVDDDVFYGYEDVEKYAHCFADIIDQKSPFTYTHSHGIANLARRAAEHLGYDLQTQNKMYLSGLLHDIGKLSVSVDILHKNGKLDPYERFEINKHTYFSRKILEQIEGFEEIVEYGVNHHEKVDGTGYPYRLSGSQLSELARVMAVCDVYQALTEERPYREKLPSEKVWSIIDKMSENGHLDKVLATKMKEIFD